MVEATQRENVSIVRILAEELEMFRIPELKNAMVGVLESKPKAVIFDLERVEFIDSSAIGAFFYFNKAVKNYGGSLLLANLGEQAAEIMRATHSLGLLNVHTSLEDAFTALDNKPA